MHGLNEQQLAFCREYATGISGKEAYARVYGKSGATAETGASRLLSKDKVQEELNRLRAETDTRCVMSRAARMQYLSASISECHAARNYSEMVRCIAELNRMDGAYEPDKLAISSDEMFRRRILERTEAEDMVRTEG